MSDALGDFARGAKQPYVASMLRWSECHECSCGLRALERREAGFPVGKSADVSLSPRMRGEPVAGSMPRFRAISSSAAIRLRSEEHTSELPSLMRTSYAVFCLKNKNNNTQTTEETEIFTSLN